MTSSHTELKVVIGSRRSQLALWQTMHIVSLLQKKRPGLHCEVIPIDTRGDQILDTPLAEMPGKGVFTAELEKGLRERSIDLAVHSLKDLPVEDAPELSLGAITARADVRDVLVAREASTLAALPAGAVVGTSSPRRRLQILAARPDLEVRPIRGNVETRVGKVQSGAYDAAVLAAAGLVRLGMTGVIGEWLPLQLMLPAPGQGALAVQCRAVDPFIQELLAEIDDPAARAETTAERAFLSGLGGGCSAPIAAHAAASSGGNLALQGLVADRDGRQVIRVAGQGTDPADLGRRLAEEALAQGAGLLLAEAS